MTPVAEVLTGAGVLFGGLLGGTGVIMEVIRRRVPNIETTADRDAKRIERRETELDAAASKFQIGIQAQLDQVRALHESCEKLRVADSELCRQDRAKDREEVATLRGQVEFLKNSLDNLTTGDQPHAKKRKAAQKATPAKAR